MLSSILVVDDSSTIRATVRSFLRGANVDVRMAEDGMMAMREICHQKPSMVLVDVMMPRLSGYQLCSIIKSHPDFDGIPVFMLTSKDTLIDKARAELAGADGFFVKPFQKQQLLNLLTSQGISVS